MQNPLLGKLPVEKSLIYIAIGAIVVVLILIFYLFFSYGQRSIKLLAPNGAEEWEIGRTYEISWKANNIDRLGIALFKGSKGQWIAKNVPALSEKYEWNIYPGQEYGADYWLAVFEYPWQKGNKIDYSDNPFAITFSELAGCEGLSVEQEWPYLPSDFPNLRKVFVTGEAFTGDLGGITSADQKCQEEAEKQSYSGKWQAFLGGDKNEETAFARLNQTPRKTAGIFISVASTGEPLIRGATCHRLLAKDFNEFLKRIFGLGDFWLGRLDEKSKKNCLGVTSVLSEAYKPLAEKYSFTSTCQNWTQGDKLVEGYPVPTGEEKPSFPTCYTPQGEFTDAVALAGLASGLEGKYCSQAQKLLCIED